MQRKNSHSSVSAALTCMYVDNNVMTKQFLAEDNSCDSKNDEIRNKIHVEWNKN